MNTLVRIGLSLARVPDELIADIDKAIPGAGRVIAFAKAAEPDLKALEPLIEQAMPIIDRLAPAMKAVWPDLMALLPTAEKTLAFVAGQQAAA